MVTLLVIALFAVVFGVMEHSARRRNLLITLGIVAAAMLLLPIVIPPLIHTQITAGSP